MKEKKTPSDMEQNPLLPRLLLFVAAAIIMLAVFPREGHFRYQFQEDRPWRYGLLTAPYSFSIYKAEDAFASERDSVLATLKPYIQQDSQVLDEVLADLENDYGLFLSVSVPDYYMSYLVGQLKKIYSAGIVSAQQLDRFKTDKIKEVMMVINNVGERRTLESLYTIKEAYSDILSELPPNLDRNVLSKECKIDRYLKENCQYDQTTTEAKKEELLGSLSQTFGMVQRNERIIDQGEIVNHDTYLKILSLKKVSEERNEGNGWILVGQILWISVLLAMLFLFLKRFSYSIFQRFTDILFLLILITVLVVATALIVKNDDLINTYMIPYAILPVMVCTFFDSRTAFFSYIITILLCAPFTEFPFEFLMVQSVVGMVAVFSIKDLVQRSQLILCILWTFITYSTVYTVLTLMQGNSLYLMQWKTYASFGINALMMLSAYLLIYLCEWVFHYTSNVTLMELANINSELLRNLSETCPGTFQHSLQVSNLAAAAASKIKANALLVRTGALYHDIGKMEYPSYYTENQNGVNPLDTMPPEDAVKYITGHVDNGLKLANKHHLPNVIKDFICSHHGCGPARYFYTLFKNNHPDEEAPAYYFYKGPNPFTRETAILMMCDSVEAASHSLKDYSELTLGKLVDNIIDHQMSGGSFKNVPLTFQEVESIKNVLKEKLKSIYHTRIAYPAEISNQKKEEAATSESDS